MKPLFSRAVRTPDGECRDGGPELVEQFIIKHRKKLLFGTDCGWWSLKPYAKPTPQFSLMREFNFSDEVKTDIYGGNAQRLFDW